MIKNIIKGDLIEYAEKGRYDMIVHGCNCFHNMEAGFARQLITRYPGVFRADCEQTNSGDRKKLGRHTKFHTGKFLIINAYTQFSYGGERDIYYPALSRVFYDLNHQYPGTKVGIPKIGTGIAGGDWDIISELINATTSNLDIEVIEPRVKKSKLMESMASLVGG